MNKTYTIQIADRTGHTTLADLQLDAAVETICTNAETHQRWVYINDSKFEFDGAAIRSASSVQKLRDQLEALVDPLIVLTGRLQGGCVVA